MRKSHLTLKIFLLIILNDLIDTTAQLLMKKGLVRTGIDSVNLGNITEFAARSASSPFLWLGIFVFALNFFVWIVILYKVPLSIAMPVGSFCYIFIPVCAMLFLHEEISLVRWAGIICIVLGIHFVAQSRKPAQAELQADG
ncbi:MAG: EamA family transporter [Candidatus Omnitrophica bacterium]|nr:EamA family transporter [Candidatus Omnitrophota bacterium]